MLVFIAGTAADIFPPALAASFEGALRERFPALPAPRRRVYRSDPVEASGWSRLQARVARALPSAPQISGTDGYQSVYLPLRFDAVERVVVPSVADPLEAGSLDALLEELRAFAAVASLPVDEVQLMQMAARYLEDDALVHQDLDVQTYVQLMLAAKQAAADASPVWIATE